jgi:hypothetical protein
MPSTRRVADCRRFPSEKGCTIAGSEDEVMDVALYHAVKSHGYEDTPELWEQLRAFLQDE